MHLELPSETNRIHETHAPTPFLAAELNAGIPDGCSLQFRVEAPDESPKI
ncbi:MAG: hypothetical protein ACI8TQ_000392 [Planctomycetota bacterium]|jgi:hypothetical protein